MPNHSPQRNFVANIFFSPNERRLRAGWRLAAHSLIFGVFTLLFSGSLGVILILTGNEALLTNLLINQVAFLVAITAATFLARRFVDRRSIASLGLARDRYAWRDLLVGFLIPAVSMSVIFFGQLSLGWLEFRGFAWQFGPASIIATTVPVMLLFFAFVGWSEELLSRGYWLQNMAEGVNLPFGILLSSVMFGVLHWFNPNATWIAVMGVILAGFFFAYAYLRTKQLWLPIGLHIGWNFFENTIFGFPVSGIDTLGVLIHHPTGPEIVTGGAFGPEAGLILLPGLLVGLISVYFYTQARNQPGAPTQH